ncbi:unnamed protein product [Nippostrongylus brasiliensis]|uniref:Secreted protein n=1 Tax=Nippostrongylus brasiliensis TaxID=27835 RepID=A0A0N4Y607_NIPBR|nr:unnamed protein product [Nippostrongylus brasiliensis]
MSYSEYMLKWVEGVCRCALSSSVMTHWSAEIASCAATFPPSRRRSLAVVHEFRDLIPWCFVGARTPDVFRFERRSFRLFGQFSASLCLSARFYPLCFS